MQIRESSPAEFLFGKLPKSLENKSEEIKQPENPLKLELLLLITGFAYALTCILMISYYQNTGLYNLDYLIVASSVLVLAIISTSKNYIQLKRYGPDLQQYHMFSLRFMIVQALVTTFLFLSTVGSIILLSQYIDFINPIAMYVMTAMIGLFIYARIISNISLISAGLGIGILPSHGGLKSLTYNFRMLYQIHGNKEYQLAILRVILWVTAFTTLRLENNVLYQVAILLGFTAFYINMEKVNGASIIMQIRSIIQDMAPSALPSLTFDNDESYIMDQKTINKIDSNKYNYTIKRDKEPQSKKNDDIIKTPTKQELTPIAARSINRIASSILNES